MFSNFFSFIIIIVLASSPIFFTIANAETVSYHAVTLDGKITSLDEYRGKAVLLNGWATWCKDCLEEMPALQELSEEFSDQGLEIIGVNLDAKTMEGKVIAFAETLGVTYTIWRDPNDSFTPTFKAIGLPHTVLFDRDGNIVHVWKGAFNPLAEDTKLRVNVALGNSDKAVLDEIDFQTIGIAVAFSAGLLSFLSPCVLPLIPAYASFITGSGIKEVSSLVSSTSETKQNQLRIRYNVLKKGSLFVLGFSLVFVVLGASVALVGSLFSDNLVWIERIGGALVILFGLHILGILKIPILERQFKIDPSKSSVKSAGALVVGMTFGAGWTPCIGPILAGILTIAAASSSVVDGVMLLSIYSAGLAIPFILSALALDKFTMTFQKLRKWIPLIEKVSGSLLIAIGLLLISGSLSVLSSIFGDTLTYGITSKENQV